MAESEKSDGLRTQDALHKMEGVIAQLTELSISRHEMDLKQSKERHDMNNRTTTAFMSSVDRMMDVNQRLMDFALYRIQTDKRLTDLEHSMSGVRGDNGVIKQVRENTKAIALHWKLLCIGIGGLIVLEFVLKYTP